MRAAARPAAQGGDPAAVEALRPDAARRWGKMSVSQMLWHVNEAMEGALGRMTGGADEGAAAAPADEVSRAQLSVGERGADAETMGPAIRQLRFRV